MNFPNLRILCVTSCHSNDLVYIGPVWLGSNYISCYALVRMCGEPDAYSTCL